MKSQVKDNDTYKRKQIWIVLLRRLKDLVKQMLQKKWNKMCKCVGLVNSNTIVHQLLPSNSSLLLFFSWQPLRHFPHDGRGNRNRDRNKQAYTERTDKKKIEENGENVERRNKSQSKRKKTLRTIWLTDKKIDTSKIIYKKLKGIQRQIENWEKIERKKERIGECRRWFFCHG